MPNLSYKRLMEAEKVEYRSLYLQNKEVMNAFSTVMGNWEAKEVKTKGGGLLALGKSMYYLGTKGVHWVRLKLFFHRMKTKYKCDRVDYDSFPKWIPEIGKWV